MRAVFWKPSTISHKVADSAEAKHKLAARTCSSGLGMGCHEPSRRSAASGWDLCLTQTRRVPGGTCERMGFRMAAQGSNAERQDGAGGVRVDPGRDRPGDTCRNTPVPRRLDAWESLAAASPARGGSAGPAETRRQLPEATAVESGTWAHRSRT